MGDGWCVCFRGTSNFASATFRRIPTPMCGRHVALWAVISVDLGECEMGDTGDTQGNGMKMGGFHRSVAGKTP